LGQKFLSIKPTRWLRELAATYLRQDGRTKFIFISATLFPVLLILVFTVLLPALAEPLDQIILEDASDSRKTPIEKQAAEPSPPPLELIQKMSEFKTAETYWQARLKLAKTKSINLSIDLADSTVGLDINGVTVRRCKIHRFDMSSAIAHLKSRGRLHFWLANGFLLQEELATLPKAPIRVKVAPKDTIEASEAAGEALPIENRDVHFTWHFDRQLTVLVEQVQTPSFSGWLSKLWYGFRRSFGAASQVLIDLGHLRLPQHRLWIELELTREDAKAIYRALPENAGLALRL
jgi:hypothetical protein